MKQLLFISLLFAAISCKAQPPASTLNKKAAKAYEDAMTLLQKGEIKKAIAEMDKAKKADPAFVEPYLVLGDYYSMQRMPEEALREFNKAFEINPAFFPNSFVSAAELEMKLGRYAEAKKHFEEFSKYRKGNGSAEFARRAEAGLRNANYAIEAMQRPVPFNPVNMGPAINTADCEYFPGVTADDGMFLFTRNRRVQTETGPRHSQEDFYVSSRNPDGSWAPAKNIGPPINTERNEGAPSLSPDGRFLFFAACMTYDGYGPGRNGLGSCDIFFSQRKGDQWTTPQNVGPPVNSESWESQPSFSSDGRTLYFASARSGGEGDADLWMCSLQDDGRWGEVKNLGKNVNTPGREEAVFIHPDNQTLYFASNGHGGMGGLDLFFSRRDAEGNWGPAQNFGYPINTFKDESGLIVNGQGRLAYFSSDRSGTLGCEDFYQFELPEAARPTAVSFMKGKVYDAKTNKPLQAGFELIDLETGKPVVTSLSDEVNGEFLLTVPANRNYALNVSKKGYVFYSESFMLKEAPDQFKPVRKDVPLQPLDTGRFVLKNIFFPTAKYDLKPESKAELQKLVTFLNTNPTVKAEIGGHTDNVGGKQDNLVLSTNRAKSVYDYLVANGVPAARLAYKGYGDTKPIADNSTPEGRAQNRRTEMKILSVK